MEEIENVPLETEEASETTDFGEIDENEFVTPPVTSINDWIKPTPKRPMIDMDTGELVVIPPVTITEITVTESGGMNMLFERPIIVPPFF